jgi:PPM family protein phosphatase
MILDNEADTMEISSSELRATENIIGVPSSVVELAALSHPGKVRANNEDSFLVTRFGRTLQTVVTNLPDGYVPDQHAVTGYAMIVADGMGGAAAGEVASRTAIKTLVGLIIQTPDWVMRIDEESAKEILQRAERRFRLLKVALVDLAKADPSLLGMGTTMTLAGTIGRDCAIAHVGDSRAYLLSKGELHQLTHDQTMAQTLVDAGVIKSEDVATHPMRHVLTGAIGTEGGKLQAELHHLRLEDGDQLLLCTDGLTEMVTDAEIAEVLRKDGSADNACRALVDRALLAGGKDNVTVVLSRYHIPQEQR